jgi:hypothetical protein
MPEGSWRGLSTFQQLEGQALILTEPIFKRPLPSSIAQAASLDPQIGLISPTGWLPSRAATEMLPPGSIVFPVTRSAFSP